MDTTESTNSREKRATRRSKLGQRQVMTYLVQIEKYLIATCTFCRIGSINIIIIPSLFVPTEKLESLSE